MPSRQRTNKADTPSALIEHFWLVEQSHETISDRIKLVYDGIAKIVEANADQLLDGSGSKTNGH